MTATVGITEQFAQAIVDAGLPHPGKLIADGNIRALQPEGWYVLRRRPVAAGGFGSWRLGVHRTWCEKAEDQMTLQELEDLWRWIKRVGRQRGALHRLELAARAAPQPIPFATQAVAHDTIGREAAQPERNAS